MSAYTVRPVDFGEFIGQPNIIEPLQLAIQSAQSRGAALDHILLTGPAGLGKTTIANIVAGAMDRQAVKLNGATAGNDVNALAGVLASLLPGAVLFIDEIHRLPRKSQEAMYTALEDFRIDLIIGEGQEAQAIPVKLAEFTCIGATTRPDLLTPPMRDRFGLKLELREYSPAEMLPVIDFQCRELGLTLLPDGASTLAENCRGVPRISLKLLNTCRDIIEVNGGEVNQGMVLRAMELSGIGPLGLNAGDADMLAIMCQRFKGRAVGLRTIAACLGVADTVLAENHEPYLAKLGLVEITPKGRIATALGQRYYEQFLGE